MPNNNNNKVNYRKKEEEERERKEIIKIIIKFKRSDLKLWICKGFSETDAFSM